ncbi:granulin [Onchocerca flexuosa]|uniref:Granulin n=1 Tax=Onchocerca flexuosa TaxID=387005 RepID=A0A238C6A0_9BILA|nr:granulin [Onchocerca flexuosa]
MIAHICPDGKSTCRDSATCCPVGAGIYGCCPMKDAVCCDDHTHCCPSATKCDMVHKQCLRILNSRQKLPKRLNNYVDPMEVFDKYGSDALRFLMLFSSIVNEILVLEKNKKLEHLTKEIRINKSKQPLKIYDGRNNSCSRTSHTCCEETHGKYCRCCPFRDAVCCQNVHYCCPKNYREYIRYELL